MYVQCLSLGSHSGRRVDRSMCDRSRKTQTCNHIHGARICTCLRSNLLPYYNATNTMATYERQNPNWAAQLGRMLTTGTSGHRFLTTQGDLFHYRESHKHLYRTTTVQTYSGSSDTPQSAPNAPKFARYDPGSARRTDLSQHRYSCSWWTFCNRL